MKKRMLIALLLTAVLMLCAAPVLAEGAVTVDIGGNGDMLALLEPSGDKTMMQWIKYWHENGAPEYIGYVSRFFSPEDVQKSKAAVDEYYTDIQAAWDGVDLREGEIAEVPEHWVVAMRDDTAENRAALAALPSNPCIFKFVPADISFNDVSKIYSEVADYARYRLPVYSVEIRYGRVHVVVSFLHYNRINQRLTEKYGDHVNVISNASSDITMPQTDQYINWIGHTDYPVSYELFLFSSAAMLLLTLLASGVTALIRKIRRGKRDGSADAAAVPKKRMRGRRVFLIVIAAELAIIACAWGVMTIICSKGYSERPTLNTDSRVLKLADYRSLEYTKTGDAESDGRTALLQATADSTKFLNHCDIMYLYKTEGKRITAAAQAQGIDAETYYQTVIRPQLLPGERAYDSYSFEMYLFEMTYDELRVRIVTEDIAKKERITVTQEDISQAGAKLGYSVQDLKEASAALDQATAKALQEKVAAFLLKNG